MTVKVVAFWCDPLILKGVGIIERTGEDNNGEPVYSPTEFGIKFIDAHGDDSQEEFEEAIERLRRAH
jgi:hypothetical protein